MNKTDENTAALLGDTFYTPDELGALTKLHPRTIRRIFTDEIGVVRVGRPSLGGRRQYYTLRIPASVASRVLKGLSVKGGSHKTA